MIIEGDLLERAVKKHNINVLFAPKMETKLTTKLLTTL